MTERYSNRVAERIAPWENNLKNVFTKRYDEFTDAMVCLMKRHEEMRLSKEEREIIDRLLKIFFP